MRPRAHPPSNTLRLGHRLQLAEGDLPGKMIEAARAGDDGLLGREPSVRPDPFGDRFPALDLGILHIHGADAELLVCEQGPW